MPHLIQVILKTIFPAKLLISAKHPYNYDQKQHKKRKQPSKKTTNICTI